jgi:hypothetical protein
VLFGEVALSGFASFARALCCIKMSELADIRQTSEWLSCISIIYCPQKILISL